MHALYHLNLQHQKNYELEQLFLIYLEPQEIFHLHDLHVKQK